MASNWINWIGGLIACLAALIFGVSTQRPDVLMLVMSVISVIVVGFVVADNWSMVTHGKNQTAIGGANARHMGFVWSLGALGLLVSYTMFLEWKEWLVFTSVFGGVALLVIGFSILMERSAANAGALESDTGDDALLKLARYLTIGQLIGMIATMIGLVVDGKMPASAQANPGWYDWAGNIIFFYGALMLAVISANALYATSKKAA